MLLALLPGGFMLAYTPSANAASMRQTALSWTLCGAATHATERQANLPDKVLQAIAIVESGRWNKRDKSAAAWPWTVTSGSQEWYMDTKQQAIAQVETLLRAGVRNIDVGCMQLNMRYHREHFNDLTQMFDPLSNVSYAATFLKRLRKSTPDWITAVGNYHSTTPKYHNRYRKRFIAIWNDERYWQESQANPDALKSYYDSETRSSRRDRPAIDTVRTAQLNQAFRNRVAEITSARTTRIDEPTQRPENGTENGWRADYIQGVRSGKTYSLSAQINRIRNAAKEMQHIKDLLAAEKSQMAGRHRSDLDKWRKRYSIAPSE
jgi:hypothetical protein